jgi:hypothetical protein
MPSTKPWPPPAFVLLGSTLWTVPNGSHCQAGRPPPLLSTSPIATRRPRSRSSGAERKRGAGDALPQRPVRNGHTAASVRPPRSTDSTYVQQAFVASVSRAHVFRRGWEDESRHMPSLTWWFPHFVQASRCRDPPLSRHGRVCERGLVGLQSQLWLVRVL